MERAGSERAAGAEPQAVEAEREPEEWEVKNAEWHRAQAVKPRVQRSLNTGWMCGLLSCGLAYAGLLHIGAHPVLAAVGALAASFACIGLGIAHARRIYQEAGVGTQ